jgi:hypothetical protein
VIVAPIDALPRTSQPRSVYSGLNNRSWSNCRTTAAFRDLRMPKSPSESASVAAAPLAARVSVYVAGRRWRRLGSVHDLLNAGRTGNVYALNLETGTIEFGDGLRGALPATGVRIVVTYRTGAGNRGLRGLSPAAFQAWSAGTVRLVTPSSPLRRRTPPRRPGSLVRSASPCG